MSMPTKAWNSIPDRTFTNCFKKSGISEKSMEKALNDKDDPFASLDVDEDVMECLKDDHENYGMTAEELVNIDFEISVTSTSSDADIIAEVSGYVDIDNEEEWDDEEQLADCISKQALTDVINATPFLKTTACFQTLEPI